MKICKNVAALSIVAFCVSCTPANDQTQPAPPPARIDHSLSTEAYLQLGMPATDRVWGAVDFQTAQQILKSLPPDQLPHWQGSPSSEIYSRMTDARSVAHCRDQAIHLNVRLQSCYIIMNGVGEILNLYVAAAQSDRTYFDDMAPMMSFILRDAVAMSGAADEFMATLDPGDPAFETRRQGFDRMNLGNLQIVQGAIVSLSTERILYSDAAAVNIAIALAETFPILAARLPPMTRAEFEGTLRHIAQSDRSAEVRTALAEFAAAPTSP